MKSKDHKLHLGSLIKIKHSDKVNIVIFLFIIYYF